MKWVIALCLLLAALVLAVVSIQEASLNSQLDARQRELGYASKKRSFYFGKRYLSLLLTAAAFLVVLPMNPSSPVDEPESSPISVMSLDPSAQKSRALDQDVSPAIQLPAGVLLEEKAVDVTDYPMIGIYHEGELTYSVYIVDNELIFQNQEGKTYVNQLK